MRTRTAEAGHRWVAGATGHCARCGLRRRETWVLDDEGRPVTAVIWSDPAGRPLRAVVFPYMRGADPALLPRATLPAAYPGLPIGREPTCRPDRFGSSAGAGPVSRSGR
ncbi:hypothetical protein [Nocardioides litoris]|uniref:hypothetical protein n=1 Tax=Nocardioides litoris TaxID=1926648 RepID=UPI0011248113|nr:hypothetical protein [Nocardioides litoris]